MHRTSTTLFSRPFRLAALFCGLLAPLLICAKLADNVWDQHEMRFDAPVLLSLHARSSPALDAIFLAITRSGGAIAHFGFVCAVAAWLLWRGRRRGALFLFTSSLGSGALNIVVKTFFHRARPALWQSIAPEPDYSFPSGHAMLSMSLAVALLLIAWPTKWRWPVACAAMVYTVAVGMSRLYLGVHFPSDVLGGWCAGLAWTMGVYWIFRGRRDGYLQDDSPIARGDLKKVI